MMDRRLFLKLTGIVAAASALEALPVAAAPLPASALPVQAAGPTQVAAPASPRLTIRAPGLYQISGRVRLDEPLVEISGITHTQTVTWAGAERPVASFVTFEQIAEPRLAPEIVVRGGQLETLSVVPVIFE